MKKSSLSILKSSTIKKFVYLLLISLVTLPGCKEEEFYYTVSVTVNGNGVVTPMQGQYVPGSEVNLIATPNAGYEFIGWTGDTRSSDNPLLLVIKSNFKINGNFSIKDIDGDGITDSQDNCSDTPDGVAVDENGCPYYTLSVTANSNNVVSPMQGQYVQGSTVNLIATPHANYVFTNWTGDIQSSENPYMLVMDSDKTINGNFSIIDADGDGITDSQDNCSDTPDGVVVDINGCSTSNYIYLDDNGVTIKANSGVTAGDTGAFGGVTYTVVDREMLDNMITRGEDLTRVVTTLIIDMTSMFYYSSRSDTNRRNFNQDISAWDVSNVTNTALMFEGATSFNQDLSAWYVSSVTNMARMFRGATSFNQDLSAWDVGNVTNMSSMFDEAASFNQDISAWDVSSVTDMIGMFLYATSFNQDLTSWNVNNVTACSAFSLDATAWILPKPNLTNCDPN